MTVRTATVRTMRTLALFLAFLAASLPALAQALPEAAVWAGFSRTSGKRLGPFEAKTLSGAAMSAAVAAEAAVLFHVWSQASDPAGEGLATAASLLKSVPGARIVVVSAESEARLRRLAASAGLDESRAAAGAEGAIRALGSPAAPAWIFVAPGGAIAAYRLGRLEDPREAVKALFAVYKPKAPAATAPGATEWSTPPVGVASPGAGSPGSGGATGGTEAASAPASPAASMPEAILAELNIARSDPRRFAGFLRDYKKLIRGKYLERPGEITVVLNEGAPAVDEAIAFLERQAPLPRLSLSAGLSRAAADHAADQGRTGQTGHTGSDRSTMRQRVERYGTWKRTIGENIAYGAESARDVVIQLIVDDGVPGRGHRTNIFNPDFLTVGIAYGPHPKYRTICVQDFAGGYEER